MVVVPSDSRHHQDCARENLQDKAAAGRVTQRMGEHAAINNEKPSAKNHQWGNFRGSNEKQKLFAGKKADQVVTAKG